MNRKAKKTYASPLLVEYVVKLEQGIAAGSVPDTASTTTTPQTEGWGAGADNTINGEAF